MGTKVGEQSSFYVGEVSVGHPPQPLRVVFDTSSGHVLLPHRVCKTATCSEHRRFSPWESSTAMDVDAKGEAVQAGQRLATGTVTRDGVELGFSQSDLGEGDVTGVLVRDTFCVGSTGDACVDMTVLAATKMDDTPFRFMPSDGIVGLGLEGLATSPLCSFFERLLEGSTGVLPQFGLAFGAEGGELHLGGHDAAKLGAPLRWFPVDHPEAGFWQVAIQAVRVGNATVDDCRQGCHGIVDSAVSRLGVQASKMGLMTSSLTSSTAASGSRCQGPDLTFDLGGMSLTLRAEDYAGRDCTPLLGALNLEEPEFVGVYAFGATVLRRYYTAFDWQEKKLGFAPLSRDSDASAARSSEVPEDMLLV